MTAVKSVSDSGCCGGVDSGRRQRHFLGLGLWALGWPGLEIVRESLNGGKLTEEAKLPLCTECVMTLSIVAGLDSLLTVDVRCNIPLYVGDRQDNRRTLIVCLLPNSRQYLRPQQQ